MDTPMAMIWLHEARGGYGYVEAVPALVVQRTPKRVSILLQRLTGEIVRRSVTSDHLRFVRSDDEMERCQPVFDALASHWQAMQKQ